MGLEYGSYECQAGKRSDYFLFLRPERGHIQVARREKVGTSPLLSHDRENLGTRTQFKGIGYMSSNSFDFLKELSKINFPGRK
jgi:hypothetical protein